MSNQTPITTGQNASSCLPSISSPLSSSPQNTFTSVQLNQICDDEPSRPKSKSSLAEDAQKLSSTPNVFEPNEQGSRKLLAQAQLADIRNATDMFSLSGSLSHEEKLPLIQKCHRMFEQLKDNLNILLDSVRDRADYKSKLASNDPQIATRNRVQNCMEVLNGNVDNALNDFLTKCSEFEHHLKLVEIIMNERFLIQRNSPSQSIPESVKWDNSIRNQILGQTRRFADATEDFRQVLSSLAHRSLISNIHKQVNSSNHENTSQQQHQINSTQINSRQTVPAGMFPGNQPPHPVAALQSGMINVPTGSLPFIDH